MGCDLSYLQHVYCRGKRCHRAKRQQRQCSLHQALQGDLQVPDSRKPLINERSVIKSLLVCIRMVKLFAPQILHRNTPQKGDLLQLSPLVAAGTEGGAQDEP